MRFGLEVLLEASEWQKKLKGVRLGLLCHPASVDLSLNHSLDLLMAAPDLQVTCAFGPQHGVRGEKQDNMIESQDFIHPKYKIPIYSLYGAFRRPQQEMLNDLDVLLIDLQDVGCRIYTYITTLFYCLEECAKLRKKLVVLDRPNPAGRSIEGNKLDMKFASFVGAAPIPMRHGLTLGEAAQWYKVHKNLDVELEVIPVEGNGTIWPSNRSWVNPSPNIPRPSCVQMYCGTVLLEGTMTSEGRGTTLPLEMFGAPGFDGEEIINKMKELDTSVADHCILRSTYFEPTFHKHVGELCGGIQVHVDYKGFDPQLFKPYRLIANYLKAVKMLYPNFKLWRDPPYEYEEKLMPIDILSGNSDLRSWVDSDSANLKTLSDQWTFDEQSWAEEVRPFLIY